jgi:hypothetical protein
LVSFIRQKPWLFGKYFFPHRSIIDEVQKLKLPSHKGFSDSDTQSVKPPAYRVANKMDKVEYRSWK